MSKRDLRKEVPPRLVADIEKWKGANIDFYLEVWRKCASPQALRGDEYKAASDLHEIGWMQSNRIPLWSQDQYRGLRIEFTAFTPMLGQHP